MNYKQYSILTREDYRLEEYLKLMKSKINKADHTTNVLFISLYDSQHLCEYFKLLADTNSLIDRILKHREYEDIHIIILVCFIKKIKDSSYNDELCLDGTDCFFYENMHSNQYHKDEYISKHTNLLNIFPNFTLFFNSEYEKYRCAELSAQRLFPIHIIEYLKNNQYVKFQEDNIEKYIGSTFQCSIKTMFLENSNIRYIFIRDA
ncbi:hypothetical protein E4O02_04195 [Treponema sp. OMZ 791]|nr:hypothetical protein [Treponema sp. OMZ 791]UTC73275.1 hypothetical protein E4O02_04195 [Treponema sp. OMZ 791]